MGMEISSGQPNISVGGGYGDGLGFGAGGGLMFLAFLAMMGMGGFGGWGGNHGPQIPNNIATTDTVNSAVQFSSLQDQNRDILNQISNSALNTNNVVQDKYSELQRDIAATAVTLANVQAQQAECCCAIKQEIAAQTLDFTKQLAQMNLEQEQRFAALNSKMDANTIQQLRDQVQDLRADMRMQGVVRFPNGYSFNAGPGPFNAQPLPFPGVIA